MAITIRGTPQAGTAQDGGNVTLTFDEAPLQNDVVVVFGGHGENGTTYNAAGISTSGYTNITSLVRDSGGPSYHYTMGAWYKVMGATPDTNVVCLGGGDVRHGVVYVAYVLRGVDTSNVTDTTATTVATGQTGTPNCASITTVTDEAWVFAFAASGEGSFDNDTSPGTVSGYSDQYGGYRNESDDFECYVARKEVTTAGAEDPGAWSTWSMVGASTWGAITVAIRPATGWVCTTRVEYTWKDNSNPQTNFTIPAPEVVHGDRLYIMCIWVADPGTFTFNTLTYNGNGLSWTQVGNKVFGTTVPDYKSLTVFRAMAASPTTGTTSVVLSTAADDFSVEIYEFHHTVDGVVNTGTQGADAIGSQNDGSQQTSTTTPSITLSAFDNADSATFMTLVDDSGANTCVPESGFTELHEFFASYGNGYGFTHVQFAEWLDDVDTTPSATFGTADNYGINAFEIKKIQAAATVYPYGLRKVTKNPVYRM